jgi:hypothetical protein
MNIPEWARCQTCKGNRIIFEPHPDPETSGEDLHGVDCPDCREHLGWSQLGWLLTEKCSCVINAGTPYDGLADPTCVCHGSGRVLKPELKNVADAYERLSQKAVGAQNQVMELEVENKALKEECERLREMLGAMVQAAKAVNDGFEPGLDEYYFDPAEDTSLIALSETRAKAQAALNEVKREQG